MSRFLDLLRQFAREAPLTADLQHRLDDPILAAGLERHQSLLQQWNPKINLSRVVDDEASARKHFLESLFAAQLLEPTEKRVVDLGSGAGFPGMPIGMLFPEIEITLLESDIRKSIFLKEVARGHANIRVLALRSNAFAKQKNQQQTSPASTIIISRAVAWSDLSKLSLALDCPLIWITSEAEFERADRKGFHVARRVSLPGNAGIAVRMFHVARVN